MAAAAGEIERAAAAAAAAAYLVGIELVHKVGERRVVFAHVEANRPVDFALLPQVADLLQVLEELWVLLPRGRVGQPTPRALGVVGVKVKLSGTTGQRPTGGRRAGVRGPPWGT